MPRSVTPDRRPNSRVGDDRGRRPDSGWVATPSPQGLKWDEMQMKKKVGLPDTPQPCRPPRRPPSHAYSRAGRWPLPRPRRQSPPPPAPSAGRRPPPHAPAAGLHRALASGRRPPPCARTGFSIRRGKREGEERSGVGRGDWEAGTGSTPGEGIR